MPRTTACANPRTRRAFSRILAGGIALTAILGGLAGCSKDVVTLEVGQCLNSSDLGTADYVDEVDPVDCAEPHDLEVYLVHTLEDRDNFPGETITQERSEQACVEAFADFIGMSYDDSELQIFMLTPSKDTWNDAGDRDAICMIQSLEPVTGTLKDAHR